jgi:hypothetical protein
VRLWQVPGSDVRVIGGPAVNSPLSLNDGRYLRFAYSVHLAHSDKAGRRVLKVKNSSIQYQNPDPDDWIFRYEFLREANSDAHPQAHLQIRGDLRGSASPYRGSLEHVHFPTGRHSLESVLRCLIEQFGVATNEDAATWRPVLATSEEHFLSIAKHPLSGPSS